jgi:hypothetical protein
MQLTTIFDADVTVEPTNPSVIGLLLGTDEDAYFLSSVRVLSFTPEATVITWDDTAISRNQFGEGGRELVLRNHSGVPLRVHLSVLRVVV